MEVLTFQSEFWIFDFLMNNLRILTCLDEIWFLKLDFDQKVKICFLVYNWLFHQLTKFHLSIQWSWEIFWAMKLGQHVIFESLILYFKPLDHVLGQKVNDQSFLVKTLICGLSVSEVILSDQFLRILEHLRSFARNCLEKREGKFWGTTVSPVQSS